MSTKYYFYKKINDFLTSIYKNIVIFNRKKSFSNIYKYILKIRKILGY